MIKSMTGFASVTRENDLAAVGVTVRTVNHRYLDLQVRLPPSLGALEPRLRATAQRHVSRGRLEITVSLQLRRANGVDVQLNQEVADALGRAVEEARVRGLVTGALSPGDLLRLPQAITIRERGLDADPEAVASLSDLVDGALADALAALERMRAAEGEHLRADLDDYHRQLGAFVDRFARAADEGRAGVEARLGQRVQELAVSLSLEPAALAQEVVRAAARADVSEEIARFRAHLVHWQSLAAAAEPCGRKLDFLLQEMHREVNTMGSKADGLDVSESIIDAKAALEKMREQVQNVE